MKKEYPPLIASGFVDLTLDDIRDMCVASFPDSNSRGRIFSRFLVFLEELDKVKLAYEMWIDGSFTTEKVDPGDVDAVVFFDRSDVNRLSLPERNILVNRPGFFGDWIS